MLNGLATARLSMRLFLGVLHFSLLPPTIARAEASFPVIFSRERSLFIIETTPYGKQEVSFDDPIVHLEVNAKYGQVWIITEKGAADFNELEAHLYDLKSKRKLPLPFLIYDSDAVFWSPDGEIAFLPYIDQIVLLPARDLLTWILARNSADEACCRKNNCDELGEKLPEKAVSLIGHPLGYIHQVFVTRTQLVYRMDYAPAGRSQDCTLVYDLAADKNYLLGCCNFYKHAPFMGRCEKGPDEKKAQNLLLSGSAPQEIDTNVYKAMLRILGEQDPDEAPTRAPTP